MAVLHQTLDHAAAIAGGEPPVHTPSERTRAILWLTAAFWASNIVIFTLANWLEGHPRLYAMAAARVALAGSGFLLCLVILAILRKLARRSISSAAMPALRRPKAMFSRTLMCG